jgi:acyl-CoA thioesterase-2
MSAENGESERPGSLDPVSSLLDALALEKLSHEDDKEWFLGPSQWQPHGRVFGGQVMGQASVAAMNTVEGDRALHSLHGYFLRPGDIAAPIEFSVDRIYDGRSFSTRRVQAFQADVPIFSMIASFQDGDSGLEHQAESLGTLPDPESLPSDLDLVDAISNPIAREWVSKRAFDVRHVEGNIFDSPAAEAAPQQAVWLKVRRPLPDDPAIHTAALAYLSDLTILEPVLRVHGLSWSVPGLKVASLDHAMWFHHSARVDQWLAYIQRSPAAQGGRGLSIGSIYTREGKLVATVAQEGMVRVPSPE